MATTTRPTEPERAVRALIAERHGVAYVEGATGRQLTWADVAARADGWAGAAPDLGTRPLGRHEPGADRTARVGLLVSDPLETAAAFLSALAAGVTVAPLNPSATPTELASSARTLGLAAIAGGAEDLEVHGEALGRAGADLWTVGPAGVAMTARGTGTAPSAPGRGAAMILSSSGTTGAPKLMPLRASELLHTARSVASHLGLEPSDCGYSPLPLFHINGLVVGVLATLVGGHRLVLDRRFSASKFWETTERTGATWLNLVPAMISVLAVRPAPDPASTERVSFARSASAPLPIATLHRFEEATGIVVLETYGMTEAGSQICANPRPPAERRPGSVGLPVGLELRVVGEDGTELPAGEIGSVEIRGASVVTEYWAPVGVSPATRPAVSADGWLATGDLGHLDAEGYVFLAGRSDDVINRGGEKVYPREVEEVLLSDPGVAAAAVVGRPHDIVGEEPIAFVVAVAGAPADTLRTRLGELCAAHLSRFRRPAEIVLVDALPSGLNGKVRRVDLRRMARSSGSAGRRHESRPLVTGPSGTAH